MYYIVKCFYYFTMILYYTIYCITLYIACNIVEYCITPQNGGEWYFSIFNRWCFYEIGYMVYLKKLILPQADSLTPYLTRSDTPTSSDIIVNTCRVKQRLRHMKRSLCLPPLSPSPLSLPPPPQRVSERQYDSDY